MPTKEKRATYCAPSAPVAGCCQVEAVVSVDERGQMVLPKEVRARAHIRAGDKFAVVSWKKEGAVCCISLVRAEALTSMVRDLLGPLMRSSTGAAVSQHRK